MTAEKLRHKLKCLANVPGAGGFAAGVALELLQLVEQQQREIEQLQRLGQQLAVRIQKLEGDRAE